MKIAIAGAGFTGLSAALVLARQKHQVTVFEKEATLGGLAAGFKEKNWQWTVERHYHHWFTNDSFAINLINDVGLGDKLIFPPSVTSIYYKGESLPFNSPSDVLRFSPLAPIDRLRVGAVLLYLKLLPPDMAIRLESETAAAWLSRYFGQKAYSILWQPLLLGKFGLYADRVNMAWFWARIKKRTPRLGYLLGGYHLLMDKISKEIVSLGGSIKFNSPYSKDKDKSFDKIIFTAPSFVFAKTYPELPEVYRQRITSIPHLFALNLLLETEDKFLADTYWLNINDRKFPFIAVVAHTNLVDKKYYGGENLPQNHRYLRMSKEELYREYLPFLAKINPSFKYRPKSDRLQLFTGPFAQPVFFRNYSSFKPDLATPLPNVILANMDMVYPWDRGTNYAIELGFKAAAAVIGLPPIELQHILI